MTLVYQLITQSAREVSVLKDITVTTDESHFVYTTYTDFPFEYVSPQNEVHLSAFQLLQQL